jgi:hypothetical protein
VGWSPAANVGAALTQIGEYQMSQIYNEFDLFLAEEDEEEELDMIPHYEAYIATFDKNGNIVKSRFPGSNGETFTPPLSSYADDLPTYSAAGSYATKAAAPARPLPHIEAAAKAMMQYCYYDLKLSKMPGLEWFRADDDRAGLMGFYWIHAHQINLSVDELKTERETLETVAHEMYHAYQYQQQTLPTKGLLEKDAENYHMWTMRETVYIKTVNGHPPFVKRRYS